MWVIKKELNTQDLYSKSQKVGTAMTSFSGVVSCFKGSRTLLTYTHIDVFLPATQTPPAKHLQKLGRPFIWKEQGEEEKRKKWPFVQAGFSNWSIWQQRQQQSTSKPWTSVHPLSPPSRSSSLYWARRPQRDGISSQAGLKSVSFDRSSVGFLVLDQLLGGCSSCPVGLRHRFGSFTDRTM